MRLGERVVEGRVPGIAVAVFDSRRTLATETAGLADVAARRPIRPTTLFEIGSIGKTFTALVVMQLVEEGRIRLDDPVARHLPWFEPPVVGRVITVHDLLTHTAGITAGTDATPEARFQVWALRELTPGSAPGIRHHYSNVGYKALGLLIEAIDGRRYAEAIRARIIGPLGMRSSEAEIRHSTRRRLAVGYDYLFDDRIGYPGRPLAAATWLETDTADGSVASTAGDMARLGRLLLRRGAVPRGRLISEASFEAMRTPHAAPSPDYAYGYGLFERYIGARTYLGHGGGMVGYQAGLQVEPASGLGAIVLQNGPGASPMDLARAAIGIFRDGREPASVDEGVADRDLVGTYLADGRADRQRIEIAESDGALVLRVLRRRDPARGLRRSAVPGPRPRVRRASPQLRAGRGSGARGVARRRAICPRGACHLRPLKKAGVDFAPTSVTTARTTPGSPTSGWCCAATDRG